ncbi:MAG: hypothetical protein ACREO3_00950 [Arenimonas sp.]
MAKWELTVRRRPTGDPADVHAQLVRTLQSLPEPWRLQHPAPLRPRTGEATATIKVRGRLGQGVAGSATYVFRSDRHAGDERFDDVFSFVFDPGKVQIAPIAAAVLPALVQALDAYRACVNDRDGPAPWQDHAAVDRTTSLAPEEGHGIHRLSPLAYYDDALIQTELGIDSRTFAQRARGWVGQFHHGVLVTMPVSAARADQFEASDEALRVLARMG